MGESLTTAQDDKPQGRGWRRRAGAWGGYIWFMSYLAQLTFVGAPLARLLYRFGVFLSTLGQSPPGADKFEERRRGNERTGTRAGLVRPPSVMTLALPG